LWFIGSGFTDFAFVRAFRFEPHIAVRAVVGIVFSGELHGAATFSTPLSMAAREDFFTGFHFVYR